MSYTYAELKQAIQDFTENDETGFVTNIPVFIRAAEDRILVNVDSRELSQERHISPYSR